MLKFGKDAADGAVEMGTGAALFRISAEAVAEAMQLFYTTCGAAALPISKNHELNYNGYKERIISLSFLDNLYKTFTFMRYHTYSSLCVFTEDTHV